MADDWDAVVVGSGPNGLVGAATLAAAGWRVLVLEAAEQPGGGLRTDELTLPGFRHDHCATALPLAMVSRPLRRLDLAADGVRFAHAPLPVAHPLDGRPAALLRRSVVETALGLGAGGAAGEGHADEGDEGDEADGGDEGDDWRRLFAPFVSGFEELSAAILGMPRLPAPDPRTVLALARFGVRGVQPATGLARRVLRDEPARALFAGLCAHAMLDLDRPTTSAYGLLLGTLAHGVGWPFAVGGTSSIADALVARVTRAGGQVVTGVRVRSLAELPPSATVLLDVTPRQFVAMASTALPDRYRRALERFRHTTGAFKVDWALDGPVPWADPAVAGAGTVHLGGTLDEVATAERTVAQGGHPDAPFVLFVQACVADPSRAPAGGHTGWAYCHVPAGSDVDMTDAIENQVERFAPGFRDRILARRSTAPADLEAANPNFVGGDISGGATDPWQALARPVARPLPWKTPLAGVYLCSASTAPGAGAHGMSGAQAARLALRSRRGRSLGGDRPARS